MLRELDGELVLRNDATGSTHLLEAFQAEVLRALIMAPGGLTTAEAAAALAGTSETQEDCLKSVEATLLDFQRLGLARRSD